MSPIDAAIPLSGTPVQGPNLLSGAQAAMTLADMASQRQLRQSQAADAQAQALGRQRAILAQQKIASLTPKYTQTDEGTGRPTIDWDGLSTELQSSGYPAEAEAMRKTSADLQSKADAHYNSVLGIQKSTNDYLLDAMTGIQKLPAEERQAAWGATRPQLAHVFGTMGRELPPTVTPEWDDKAANQTINTLTSRQERLDQALKAAQAGRETAATGEAEANTEKAKAETAYLQNYGKLSGTEAFAVDAYAKSIGKGINDLTPDERTKAMQYAKIANEDPAMRAMALSLKALELQKGDPNSPQYQDKLEKDYRGALEKVVNSRSGGMGLEDQKVNQAKHLLTIFDQYKDPKTGGYNIPITVANELAVGLAKLTSNSGTVGEGMAHDLNQATAAGDVAKLVTYVTGTPVTGNTQDVFKMFRDSIDRQGRQAQSNRQTYLEAIKAMAPTDLHPDRKAVIEKALNLNTIDTPAAASGGAAPDLAGLQPGHNRRFTVGPYAGQVWTIENGQPKKVS